MDTEELLKENLLPEDLRFSPFRILSRWLDEATGLGWQANPNAMVISTVTEKTVKTTKQAQVFDNEAVAQTTFAPDARVVLCKGMDLDKSYLEFYTNYQSSKGEQLKHNPLAAAVFHWDNLGRQVRVRGRITKAPAMDSEKYFNTRHPLSRLGTWASDQSQPIASRDALLNRLADEKNRFKDTLENVPRPPHWGGYRLWASEVELWISHPGRIHDRALWTRELRDIQGDELHFSKWSATRLQP